MQSEHPDPHATPGDRTPDLAEAIKRGYEPKDISLRGLFIFLGTLIVTLVVVLFFIYGVLMFLVERDRSHDPLGTPVTVVRAEQYAPLQPSVGHNVLDTDDMLAMREQNQQTLDHPTLSRQMPIGQAMDRVLPLLIGISKPAVPATTQPVYPEGSYEGRYTGGIAAQAE
jgi:hypothetical protein